MPRTQTAAAPAPRGRKRKKAARPPLPPGWRTTDEDEIERRRQRAAGEPLAVAALEPGTLLGATEDEARSWLAGGEILAAEIARELREE